MSAENTKSAVKVLVLSIYQDMGESFVGTACPDASNGTGELDLYDITVQLDVLAGDPRLNASWDKAVSKADALMLLVKFLDVISVDKMRAIYRRLSDQSAKPVAVLILRDEGETDFKISCPICGQKLWIRDSDSNKRGRCPNCKKAFTLPEQGSHLKGQLAIPEEVPVIRAISENPESVRSAVFKLVKGIPEESVEQSEGG